MKPVGLLSADMWGEWNSDSGLEKLMAELEVEARVSSLTGRCDYVAWLWSKHLNLYLRYEKPYLLIEKWKIYLDNLKIPFNSLNVLASNVFHLESSKLTEVVLSQPFLGIPRILKY